MTKIKNIACPLCSLGTVIVFLTFLLASAPHRVHHLLENVPAPKVEQPRHRELSIASAPGPQASGVPSAESHSSAHDHGAHDHSAHSHHPGKNAGHRHRHAHSHAHSHSHDAAPVQSQTAAAPVPSSASEPLHANAPKRDAHHDGSARTDCVVQAATQQAHYAPVEITTIAFLDTEPALRLAVRSENFTFFDPSPLSQRAPPRI